MEEVQVCICYSFLHINLIRLVVKKTHLYLIKAGYSQCSKHEKHCLGLFNSSREAHFTLTMSVVHAVAYSFILTLAA